MLNALRKQPWYLLLLPVFFVMHGFSENFGFINFWDVTILAFTYVVSAVILFLLFYLVFKNRVKAALVSSFIMAFNLFFGAIQDFFKIHANVFHKYSVLIPVFLILLIGLIIYLKRTKVAFSKLNLFLNSLLLIYIIVDISMVLYKSFNPPSNKLSAYSFAKNKNFQVCKECSKPDIYFFLFDEYASTFSLKEHFNYDNSSLDSFLNKEEFNIQQKSKSNYNFTPFSMASILNMAYLTGIEKDSISIEDYARCNELIRNNNVINFLSAQGYEIKNYSIFDLAGNPSMITQNFLPLKTKLISDGTFVNRFQKDLGWMFITGRFKIKWLADEMLFNNLHSNEKFIDLVEKSSGQKSAVPRFFYTHLFLPHPPFYYDKNGNRKSNEVVYKEWREESAPAYLDYVAYTNSVIKQLVSTIKKNSGGAAVIIIMGDHGFREPTPDHDTEHYFQDQNAVYFPAKNYTLLYDSITAVNQFRVVFNTLFRHDFPLLKDSTVFLTDKK